MKLSSMASARRLAAFCLDVTEEKRKEILDHLDSEWRIKVVEQMKQIREKREKSI